MKTLILGPTFRVEAGDGVGAVVARLEAWVRDGSGGYEVQHVGGMRGDGGDGPGERSGGEGAHFHIAVGRGERNRWSPWLTLEFHERDGGSLVIGRFNPSPGIWTAYMLGTLGLGMASLIAAMWGAAEMTMGASPRALWVIPGCVVVFCVMWGVSAAGQRLACGEMEAMREVVERVVGGAGY